MFAAEKLSFGPGPLTTAPTSPPAITNQKWGLPKIKDTLFFGGAGGDPIMRIMILRVVPRIRAIILPYHKDEDSLGSFLGSPYLGKLLSTNQMYL